MNRVCPTMDFNAAAAHSKAIATIIIVFVPEITRSRVSRGRMASPLHFRYPLRLLV